MVNTNPLSPISQLFDTEFGANCEYAWPFPLELAEHFFQFGYTSTSLGQLIDIWETSSTDDLGESEEELLDDLNELQKIKNHPASSWAFDKLVCSAICFLFDYTLRTEGRIDSLVWYDFISNLSSFNSEIRVKILTVVQNNGFF
jgi:hypothetical protein